MGCLRLDILEKNYFPDLSVSGKKALAQKKGYENKDHLGNVRVVISDRKEIVQGTNTGNDPLTIDAGDYFEPIVVSLAKIE